MDLNDFSKVNATKLNEKMKAKIGWNIKLEGLRLNKARSMLESVNTKLWAIKHSTQLHESQNNPNYTSMLLVKKVLEQYIIESSDKAATAIKNHMMTNNKSLFNRFGFAKVNSAINKVVAESKTTNVATCTRMVIEKIRGRQIFEDQVTQAQSVMAAKDMVDSIQDMLEDLSKMLNEQLPPLTDSIRANIGEEQSAAFQQTASSTITTLLQSAQKARQDINNAVLALTGEGPAQAAPMSMPNDNVNTDLDMDNLGGDDDFAASDAAEGGNLPLGREKR